MFYEQDVELNMDQIMAIKKMDTVKRKLPKRSGSHLRVVKE